MGKRIHSRGGGDRRRQADGQLGIEDHRRRHHLRMEDDPFDVFLLIGDDRRAPHLGTSSRGRGHGDHRRYGIAVGAFPVIADILQLPDRQVIALSCHQGHRLGGIQTGATAEGDDTIVAALAKSRYSRFDVGPGRVALDLAEHGDLQALAGTVQHQVVHHRQARQAGIGHQQGGSHAQCLASFRQFPYPPCPGENPGRIVPGGSQLAHVVFAPHILSLQYRGHGTRRLLEASIPPHRLIRVLPWREAPILRLPHALRLSMLQVEGLGPRQCLVAQA